jgi:Calcium/calmodulin dependent protein kinase II association domain
MADDDKQELVRLTERLLDSIAQGDWPVYQELCDPSLTAFEPESLGQLVEGMEFHRFYFSLGGKGRQVTTMCAPRVRVMGEVAVVAYIRLDRRISPDGQPYTSGVAETRVWQRIGGAWKHVHFHRSPMGSGQ